MSKETIHELTQSGLEKKQLRLEELINIERPKNIKEIKEARAQGDLSENADYDAARNRQSEIEAEIRDIEEILKNYKLIAKVASDTVVSGSTVTVLFNGKKASETYEIVGELEANPFDNKLSNKSPLFLAIEGKKAGDKVDFISHGEILQKVKIVEVK